MDMDMDTVTALFSDGWWGRSPPTKSAAGPLSRHRVALHRKNARASAANLASAAAM